MLGSLSAAAWAPVHLANTTSAGLSRFISIREKLFQLKICHLCGQIDKRFTGYFQLVLIDFKHFDSPVYLASTIKIRARREVAFRGPSVFGLSNMRFSSAV